MRLRSVHPGVSVDDVVAATGFALSVPDDVPETRQPTGRRADADPGRLDPPDPRARDRVRRRRADASDTRLTDLLGVRYPIVQTGMGWVAGARLDRGDVERGRARASSPRPR